MVRNSGDEEENKDECYDKTDEEFMDKDIEEILTNSSSNLNIDILTSPVSSPTNNKESTPSSSQKRVSEMSEMSAMRTSTPKRFARSKTPANQMKARIGRNLSLLNASMEWVEDDDIKLKSSELLLMSVMTIALAFVRMNSLKNYSILSY